MFYRIERTDKQAIIYCHHQKKTKNHKGISINCFANDL